MADFFLKAVRVWLPSGRPTNDLEAAHEVNRMANSGEGPIGQLWAGLTQGIAFIAGGPSMQDGVTWGGGNTGRPPHGAGLVEGAVRTHNEQGGMQGGLAHREGRSP